MNQTIDCVSMDEVATILGVTTFAEYYLMVDALATRPTDARVLYRIARTIRPSIILEIGTFYGHTTVGLARNCPYAQVYTVDISAEMRIPVPPTQSIELLPRSEVGKRFQNRDLNIMQIIGDSRIPATYSNLPLIDMAYIDGNHSYDSILQDSTNVVAACRSGGVVVWHDYKDDGSVETIPALRDFASKNGYRVDQVEGTWLALMIVP